MEKLQSFKPKDLFKGLDRVIIKGGIEPWTMRGKTKLKAGGKIDVPISIFGLEVPLVAIFDIARVDMVKLKDLSAEHKTGNMPKPDQHLRYGDAPVTPESDVMIVHVEPTSIQIQQLPIPRNRRKPDGSFGPCMI